MPSSPMQGYGAFGAGYPDPFQGQGMPPPMMGPPPPMPMGPPPMGQPPMGQPPMPPPAPGTEGLSPFARALLASVKPTQAPAPPIDLGRIQGALSAFGRP